MKLSKIMAKLIIFFFRILNIFNTHTEREDKILKKLTVVYIQKRLLN